MAPLLGGLAIDAGYGYASVAWVGSGLAVAGAAGVLWAAHLRRSGPEREATRPRTAVISRETAKAEA